MNNAHLLQNLIFLVYKNMHVNPKAAEINILKQPELVPRNDFFS